MQGGSMQGKKRPAKSRSVKDGVKKPRLAGITPTVQDILDDRLTPIANQYWGPGQKKLKPYDPKVIEDIYAKELKNASIVSSRVVLLELSSYLENYLWKNFNPKKASFAHLMSIVLLVNEKFRSNLINVWEPYHSDDKKLTAMFKKIFSLPKTHSSQMSMRDKIALLLFLIHSFQSLEDPVVRQNVLRLTNLRLWRALSPGMLERQLKAQPQLLGPWKQIQKSKKKTIASTFLPHLLETFYDVLVTITPETDVKDADAKMRILYCERFLEFCIDLNAQLPTRRFFLPLLMDTHFIVRCSMSDLAKMATKPDGQDGTGKLFSQLLQVLCFYQDFEIDIETGAALSDDDLIRNHYSKLEHFQRLVFKHMRDELPSIPLATISEIDRRESLLTHLSPLPAPVLQRLAVLLKLIKAPTAEAKNNKTTAFLFDAKFLVEALVSYHQKKRSQKEEVKALPLYPVESVIWDENMVPSINYTGEGCLALPKLNLQFLTFHDYLLRNFDLFRLESTYEIREDIVHTVERLQPCLSTNGETVFTGWARMALPLYSFSIQQVKKPNVGETKPALVKGEIQVDLSPFQGRVREEWNNIREHDVMFLLCVKAVKSQHDKSKSKKTQQKLKGGVAAETLAWEEINREELGIVSVRGCEVKCVLDEKDKIIGARNEDGSLYQGVGNMRTFRVHMDCAQYQADMTNVLENDVTDVYTTFNLLLRRKPKENNFKAVLRTIRDLMEIECAVPAWLKEVFLGYGDPQGSQYYNLKSQIQTIRFRDTFLDRQHLLDSFPEQLDFVSTKADLKQQPPYELTFALGEQPDFDVLRKRLLDQLKRSATDKKQSAKVATTDEASVEETQLDEYGEVVVKPVVPGHLRVKSYFPVPIQNFEPKRNTVRFTPMQVAAIKSGLNPGLTMVVGPPGTGKTDTAVQMMAELYHNFPNERTLLVTHSNHALNDLFEKIMERDIPERYLVRLGRGQESLHSDKDFSKFGRVNHMLQRRLARLQEVSELSVSLSMEDNFAHNCEAAGHFYLFHVVRRWEEFQLKVKPYESADSDAMDTKEEDKKGEEKVTRGEAVRNFFPFMKFFRDRAVKNYQSANIFSGDFDKDMQVAASCMKALKVLFNELEETRPFELLRRGIDRGNFLLTKHAKVIAMTCTHAAIKRGDLIDLGFQYDNLIMEEAAQILEIETFIPMLLQNLDPEFGSRLKRVILLGDHHQLPPVIKNRAFQKYSHLDQSMFTRFVRLGMPYIQLDAQGRSRPSIAKLWNWRYNRDGNTLGNLPNVINQPIYKLANIGLRYEYQFVNVEDYNGEGESTPSPYFYQNLGEAEFVAQTFMYMRLMGIPCGKISIITTYNGQKALIRDVIEARCANHPLFGSPRDISTVDKFQGQQNDYILISMVRTKAAGHIRDVRRLVVAMSRARLGLYVFGRQSLFSNSYELAPTFSQLLSRPANLHIIPQEVSQPNTYFPNRAANQPHEGGSIEVKDLVHMGQIVSQMATKAQERYTEYQRKVDAFEAEKTRQAEAKQRRAQLEEESKRAQVLEEKELDERLDANDAAEAKLSEVEKHVIAKSDDEDAEDEDTEMAS